MFYLAEDGVNVVEVRLPRVRDEELTLVGVWSFTCHRHLREEGLVGGGLAIRQAFQETLHDSRRKGNLAKQYDADHKVGLGRKQCP